MRLVVKTYDELAKDELYRILQARVAVFVVEQKCPYQELDGKDAESFHVFYEGDDGAILAYLRAFVREPGVAQLGRVLTIQRGTGLGGKILKVGIEQVRKRFASKKIYLEAQEYARGFYEREGFETCGEVFLEDGIPHVAMELVL